jgi:hypothetical protein
MTYGKYNLTDASSSRFRASHALKRASRRRGRLGRRASSSAGEERRDVERRNVGFDPRCARDGREQAVARRKAEEELALAERTDTSSTTRSSSGRSRASDANGVSVGTFEAVY